LGSPVTLAEAKELMPETNSLFLQDMKTNELQ